MKMGRARANRRVNRERRTARRRAVTSGMRLGIVALGLGVLGWHGVRAADARGWLSPFRVRDVRVVGARIAHPRVLVAEAGLMGRRLSWWSSLGAYAEQVERDPMIASATFERRFPNGLTLIVEERRPIALVELERLTPVDVEGRVLPVSAFQDGWDVPVLALAWKEEGSTGRAVIGPGPVRDAVDWLVEVRRHYPALYRELSAVELESSGTITLRLVHTEGVIVLDRTTPIEKLALVDDVLRDLREKGIEYMDVDLRFEDQIVVRRG
ncbi:MAG TPA: FtsQ-type POTRA domain-containing protein [Candidatus Polarisedimenticolia bacterium]|nr:FtsQ-type POTRA domain-containing protein [Candidatus Polarisedimenticolia bacterium]